MADLKLRRVWWAGPLTVVAAVIAVCIVQWLATRMLSPVPSFLHGYIEPAVITAVLVGTGVAVFAVVVREASQPIRTFRRLAFVALLVSFLPDIGVGLGLVFAGERWPLATVFMLQHVIAWATTVWLLPRLAHSASPGAE